MSRNRDRFKHRDPLAAALANRLRVNDAILDGEVICVHVTGRPIFIDLLRRKEPCFVPFDLLWLNGEDICVRCRSSNARRGSGGYCGDAVDGRGKALMAVVEEHELEGSVCKRKATPIGEG